MVGTEFGAAPTGCVWFTCVWVRFGWMSKKHKDFFYCRR